MDTILLNHYTQFIYSRNLFLLASTTISYSILFGCGLISNEDIETFTWLFRTWLSYMSNSAPIGIITDQDKAMKAAIENVFPNTRHRWCLWHILKKIPEKLGAIKNIATLAMCCIVLFMTLRVL